MLINWKKMLLALYRIEEQQQEILARLERREQAPALQKSQEKNANEWLQEGIDNIMSFQAGGKRGKSE